VKRQEDTGAEDTGVRSSPATALRHLGRHSPLHPLDDSQLLALICAVLHGREKSGSVLKP